MAVACLQSCYAVEPFAPANTAKQYWRARWRAITAHRSGLRWRIAALSEPRPALDFGAPFPDRRLAEEIILPPLRQCRLYLNLTNGIEALPQLQQHSLPFSFIRIQSTACEQQHFEKLMNDLDADLLLHLALGYCCIVVDYGSRNKKRGASRALWLGTEFIRYALTRMWLERPAKAYLRGHSVHDNFERHVQSFSKSTKKRLRYFKRYLPEGGLPEVQLIGAYSATEHDDDEQFYRATLHTALLPAAFFPGGSSSSGHAVTVAGPAAAAAIDDRSASAQPDSLERGSRAAAAMAAGLPCLGSPASSTSGISSSEPVSQQQREALLDGDCNEAVQRLLGLHLFLGGLSHAVMQRLEREWSSTEEA